MLLNSLAENNLQINIYHIQRNDEFKALSEKYFKLISKYATLKEINLWNKQINKTQAKNHIQAKKSYEQAFSPYKKDFCIVLDEKGKELNSKEFSKVITDKNTLNFFIGGAYGLSEEFIQDSDLCLSLSRMTLAHGFVKFFLLEQLYRAFCIKYNHPYHKE